MLTTQKRPVLFASKHIIINVKNIILRVIAQLFCFDIIFLITKNNLNMSLWPFSVPVHF